MRHPDISDWTDYVRAIDGENDRAALESHLDEGCVPCRTLVTTLERVSTTAEVDTAATPPAGVIRSVKAYFQLQHCASRCQAFEQESRQMLFESDLHTLLQLSLDCSRGETGAALRGELLEAHGEPHRKTPVFLRGDGELRLSLEPKH